MKIKITHLIALLVVVLFGVGCASTKVLPTYANEGLAAYYPFDGNATDMSSNGNHGKITGATATSDRLGNANGALNFDADLDYVEIPHSESLSFKQEDFTISMWLRYPDQRKTDGRNRSAQAHVGVIFTKSDPKIRDRGYPGVSMFVDTKPSYHNVRLRLTGEDDVRVHSKNKAYEDDTWRHFVFRKSGKNLSIYVNAEQVSSGEVSILNTYMNDALIVIGANHANREGQNYRGRVDELRIYSRALSAEQIKGLYDYEKP